MVCTFILLIAHVHRHFHTFSILQKKNISNNMIINKYYLISLSFLWTVLFGRVKTVYYCLIYHFRFILSVSYGIQFTERYSIQFNLFDSCINKFVSIFFFLLHYYYNISNICEYYYSTWYEYKITFYYFSVWGRVDRKMII